MPGTASSSEVMDALPRFSRCAVMAKRCASSRMRCTRKSPWLPGGSRMPSAPARQEELLALLGQAGHRHDLGQAEFGQHLDGHAKLALAAVHDQQVGQPLPRLVRLARLAARIGHRLLDRAAEAAAQHLAHGRRSRPARPGCRGL